MKVKISKRMTKPDFQADFLSDILKAAADPNRDGGRRRVEHAGLFPP